MTEGGRYQEIIRETQWRLECGGYIASLFFNLPVSVAFDPSLYNLHPSPSCPTPEPSRNHLFPIPSLAQSLVPQQMSLVPNPAVPAPPPAPAPIALGWEKWDFDEVLRAFLNNQVNPPTREFAEEERQDMILASRGLHRQAWELVTRKRELPVTEHSSINNSIAQRLYQRKILLWKIFPINRLPPEILSNVFRFISWTTSQPDLGDQLRCTLTSVCHYWRVVAISDATLWNAVWIRDTPPHHRSFTYLERAGDAPLDVRINDPNSAGQEPESKYDGEVMMGIMNRLIPKLPQIRMLIIIVTEWPAALAVLDRLRQAVRDGLHPGIFKRFEMHRIGEPYVWLGRGYTPEEHRIPMALLNGVAPALDYVCINGVQLDWDASPLSNLTTLDVRRMSLESCPSLERFRDILRDCPRLYKLALDGAGPKWHADVIVYPDPIIMPALEIVIFGDISVSYALFVASQFIAPHCQDLTMLNMSGEDYGPLLSLITGRYSEVKVLTLYSFDIPAGTTMHILVNWLRSMPDLRYLKFARSSSRILQALVEDPRRYDGNRYAVHPLQNTPEGPNVICPKLDIIEWQSVSPQHIIDFGFGRRRIGVPLKKTYINEEWIKRLPKEYIPRLHQVAPFHMLSSGQDSPEERGLMQLYRSKR
ncbi:hypothetical protein JAAARDRAFT_29281 [Jaapia argillacea MUCL 33604]|uniref:F-box domain-containing protein n=1 Tax=Jaapia argillacea MUCL 33604 TaxID=933084 RepID=A0A067QIB0_9AGAM|nr:hypothetical protein JAAARDRAFT_29281 [Jaapia argillacea MUCL 33604]